MNNPHHWPVRIYYEDTDSGGIVYYANYLKYAERARTEFLRELGIESRQIMETMGIGLAVRRCNVEYVSPAKLDDLVAVETTLQKVGHVSMEMRQVIRRDTLDLVQMDIKLGSINFDSGRPSALPKDMKAALEIRMNASSN